MKWFVIKISAALLFSVLLCDIHMLIYWKFRETSTIETDLFLDPTFNYKQSVIWYIYDLALIFKGIVWS